MTIREIPMVLLLEEKALVATVESDELDMENPAHAAWVAEKLARLSGAGAVFFGCFAGEALAGFATVVPEARPPEVFGGWASAELAQIGVAAAGRRQGAGAALLRHMEGWLQARHTACLYLHTWAADEVAIAFYTRCGYTPAGEVPGVYGPGTPGMLYFYKLLA